MKLNRTLAAAVLISFGFAAVPVAPANAVEITIDVKAPQGFEIKRVNRKPTEGAARHCLVDLKGHIQVMQNTCDRNGRNCRAACFSADGKKIDG